MVALLVHLISCDTSHNDVKFKLFEYEHKPLDEKLVEMIEEVDKLGLALKKIDGLALDYAADAVIMSPVKSAVDGFMNTVITAKAGKIAKKKEADAVKNEIEHSVNMQHISDIQNRLSTIQSEIQKSSFDSSQFEATDNELYKVVVAFAKSDSPFYKYPELAGKVLIPLSGIVKSFMTKLGENGVKADETLYKITEVPCMLKFALREYWKPIIFNRLNAIRVNADQSKCVYKYQNIKSILDSHQTDTYPPNSMNTSYIKCQQIKGNKTDYEIEVAKELPRYKFVASTVKYLENIWELAKSLFSGGHFKLAETVESFFEPSRVSSNRVYMRDNLGEEKVYYIGDDGSDTCIHDYFSLLDYRINDAFMSAIGKMDSICKFFVSRYEETGNFFTKLIIMV